MAQYYGSLRRQDISSHDIDYVEYVSSGLTWGRILNTYAISLWSNDIKCKCMFMFPLKNVGRKGLIQTAIPNSTVCHSAMVTTTDGWDNSSPWGQHGAHLGPVDPRWAPYWPHEPCYLGSLFDVNVLNGNDSRNNSKLEKSDYKYCRFYIMDMSPRWTTLAINQGKSFNCLSFWAFLVRTKCEHNQDVCVR